MLVNTQSATQSQVVENLRKIENSSIPFYLTGSRFFGNYTKESDYDFFVDSAFHMDIKKLFPELRVAPMDIPGYEYRDNLTVCVYAIAGIHIQLVKDAKLKNMVQKYIAYSKQLFNDLKTLPKSHRKHVWNKALAEVQAILAD